MWKIEGYKPVEGYKYVALNSNGIPYIIPTTMKVEELIIESNSFRWTPRRLYEEHPYLSLAQIFCALSYYHDHKDEIDNRIKLQMQLVSKMRKSENQKIRAEKFRQMR